MEPLVGTKTGTNAIARVKYTHDGMIDLILANPMMRQGEIAAYFGFTEGWVSRVMGSDAFNKRLAERKDEVVTPGVIATMEERLTGLAIQSIEVLQKKLEATSSPDIAVKSLELSTKALGMGARIGQQNTQVNNYVVALPPKVSNEGEWAQQAAQSAKDMADRARLAKQLVVDAEIK